MFSPSCPRLFLPRLSVCACRVLCVLSLFSGFLLVFLFPSLSPLQSFISSVDEIWTKVEEEEEERLKTQTIEEKKEEEEEDNARRPGT